MLEIELGSRGCLTVEQKNYQEYFLGVKAAGV